MNCFSHVFWHLSNQKNYQRKSSILKHTVVNNNKVRIESRIVRIFKVGFNITNSRNHKS